VPEQPSSQLRDDPEGLDLLLRPAAPRSWRERGGDLADATGTTPARLVGGAIALALAVAAGLWLTRPAEAPPELSLPFASTAASSGAPPSASTTAPAEVVVDVGGAVLRPGVLHLPAGSRVVDAIDAAGGLAPDADGARVNRAAPLADGQQVYVPRAGEPMPAGVAGAGGGAASAPSGPLDLNTADEVALDALPGIGPATARAIVDHRREIGRFTTVDQLLDVRGIGAAKLEQLRPLVTV
jgi:competence protein ComEA